MNLPTVEVVIACHDERRPIERAVASVLQDEVAFDNVRVTVIAHGLPADVFEERLAGVKGDWRVVAFHDGIRSAAGPFNRGLDLATADYIMVMGSDDFLEPGAMAAWLAHVRLERPSVAVFRMRIQGDPIMPNPLTRIGRTHHLDAASDRLFYRTAPLALIAREEIDRLGLRMTEDLRVGEDFDFGIRLWAFARRIDFLAHAGCYVIGTDAVERTTHAPLSIEQSLAAIVRLLDDDLPARLSAAHRRALAIKLVRTSVLAAVRSRPIAADWQGGDEEVAQLRGILLRILALAPHVLTPFSRQDRPVLDGLLKNPTVAQATADAAAADRAGRVRRWLTANPLHSFDHESTLRRYVLYFLKRDRNSPQS